MIRLLIRFPIVYFATVFSMKLMGKRQIGELQTSELVTTFFLSELATCAVTDDRVPLLFGLVPILALLSLEVVISYLSIKIPFFKRWFDHTPSILIRRGKLNTDELRKNRLSIDEFLSLLRLEGAADPARVRDVILEPNGKISVFFWSKDEPAGEDGGIAFAFVEDGKINKRALKVMKKDEAWLRRTLKEKGYPDPEKIFVYTRNDAGGEYLREREE